MNDQAAGISIVQVLVPVLLNAGYDGPAVDLKTYTGSIRVTQAVSMVDGPFIGVVQDSADGSSWANITGGSFTATSSTGFETLTFNRRSLRRYIRWSTQSAPVDAVTSVTMAATPIRA